MSFTRTATLLYAFMALGAFCWTWVQGRALPWVLEDSAVDPWNVVASLGIGFGLGQLVVWITPWLVRHTRWAQALHHEMRGLLASVPPGHIPLLALLSGMSEELFFRGALQPVVGLYVASLIFGLLHIGPKLRFLPWTIWALLMGLAFGALFEWTGVLWGSVLAHVWINYRNMRFLQRHPCPTQT